METILVFRTGTLGTWREKLGGITAFAKAEGWRVQTVDARAALPDVRQLCAFWRPVGILLDASGRTDGVDARTFASLPCVALTPSSDRVRRAFPSVQSDSHAIARLAAQELLRRNVAALAFLDAPGSPSWSSQKREAFRAIARLHGLALTVVTAETAAALPPATGLFAATDALAAEALAHAERAGLRVPEDLAVVGVDDDPEICESCEPTLSSVRPDFHRLGFSAAALLAERLRAPCAERDTVLIPPVGLVRRASSSGRSDAAVRRALDFIRQHAHEGLTAADVAPLFGAQSRRAAEIRFKDATGQTMTDAILDARLRLAKDYLSVGRTAVSAIANFCGWDSDLAFRKAFKARVGQTPTAFRAAARTAFLSAAARQNLPRSPISNVRGSPAKHS